MLQLADVAGSKIFDGFEIKILFTLVVIGIVGAGIGWLCGFLHRRQRRR